MSLLSLIKELGQNPTVVQYGQSHLSYLSNFNPVFHALTLSTPEVFFLVPHPLIRDAYVFEVRQTCQIAITRQIRKLER